MRSNCKKKYLFQNGHGRKAPHGGFDLLPRVLQESKEGFPGGKGFLIGCFFFLGKAQSSIG